MSFSLQPETERLIEERLQSGEYGSADEVVRRALCALAKEDQQYATRIEALRGEIQKGLDDLDKGRRRPMEEAFTQIKLRRGMTV